MRDLDAANAAASRPSALIAYALKGLRRCWMPETERYSHRFRFREGTTESIFESDIFYTLNVLLGLSRIPRFTGYEYVDINNTYAVCCNELRSPGTRTYAYGMALWA